MKNSLLVIFGKNCCTIVQGHWPDFGATLKIHKKSNFDWNQLKISTQHKYMYMHQYIYIYIYINGEFSVHVHVSQTFRPSNVVRRLKFKSNT